MPGKVVPVTDESDLLWRPDGEELDFRIFGSIGSPSLSDHRPLLRVICIEFLGFW